MRFKEFKAYFFFQGLQPFLVHGTLQVLKIFGGTLLGY
jgi:hypothetical protein